MFPCLSTYFTIHKVSTFVWVFPCPCLVLHHLATSNLRVSLQLLCLTRTRSTTVCCNECSSAPSPISVSPLFGSDYRIAEDRNVISASMKQNRSVDQEGRPTYGGANADPKQKRGNITCRFYQAGYCQKGTSCTFSHKLAHPHCKPRDCTSQSRAGFPHSEDPQSRLYYPNASTLPFSLWHPAYNLSPPVSVWYASLRTAAADSALRDGLYDTSSSEGSSLCATLSDHDMYAAFRSLDDSGSPTLLPPVALRRQSTAAPFFPEHSFTDWTTYSTSCNAKADPYGRFVMPPFVAQPPMQSTGPSHDKRTPRMRKPFACQTKPCRYFVATGKCPNGDKCTFIHDSVPRKSMENSSNTSTSINARELASKKHDCQSKDFYPITWRVIGGGVMMGGERKICDAFIAGHCGDGDDCKFAHETALETDPDGCLRLRSEAEVPAARMSVRDANGRGLKSNGEEPTVNAQRGHSQQKQPCGISASTARLPVSTEPSQQITPRGSQTEQTNLRAQKIGEVKIASEVELPTSTVSHRRTRSMIGPPSLLHAEPNVTSPSFLAEF